MKVYCAGGAKSALSYRIKRAVTEAVRYSPGGYSYPLCPRCRRGLEREFVGFCDRCGQRVDWKSFGRPGTGER